MLELLIRRAFAASLDAAFIACPLIVAGVVITGLDGSWTNSTTIAAYVFVALYFSLCHLLGGGRTLGKWVFGIRVQRVDGMPLTGFDAFVRALSPLLTVLATMLAYRSINAIVFVPFLRNFSIRSALDAALILSWPLSVMFSGGASSLSDALARTCVVVVRKPILRRSRLTPLRLALASVVTSMLIYVAGSAITNRSLSGLMSSVEDAQRVSEARSKSPAQRLVEALYADVDGRRVEQRSSKYTISIRECTSRDHFSAADGITVRIDSIPTPGRHFTTCFDAEFEPRLCSQLLSYDYVSSATNVLAAPIAKRMPSDALRATMVIYHITCSRNLGFVFAGFDRTLLGLYVPSGDGLSYVVIQPDRKANVNFGVTYSGIL